MAVESYSIRPVPRWLHVWAILTAVATLPLLALGGLVTTRRVGMADPEWPTTPWFLVFNSWTEPRPGYLIEHTHRFAGWVVGCLVIVLTVGLWRVAKSNRLRWLGIACFVGVCLQGLLGGFRVKLNELLGTDLATIHGCFAQVYFCLLISVSFLTRAQDSSEELDDLSRKYLCWVALLLTSFVFMQLVWGALVRHNPTGLVQRFHLITAFFVVAISIWFIKTARESRVAWEKLRMSCLVLSSFLLLQVILGVEAWMGKFATNIIPELQILTTEQVVVRTAHVLVGTGIFATSVVLILQCQRWGASAISSLESSPLDESGPMKAMLVRTTQIGGAT